MRLNAPKFPNAWLSNVTRFCLGLVVAIASIAVIQPSKVYSQFDRLREGANEQARYRLAKSQAELAKLRDQIAAAQREVASLKKKQDVLNASFPNITDRRVKAEAMAELQTIVQKMAMSEAQMKSLLQKEQAARRVVDRLKLLVAPPSRGSQVSRTELDAINAALNEVDRKSELIMASLKTETNGDRLKLLTSELLALNARKEELLAYKRRLVVRGGQQDPMAIPPSITGERRVRLETMLEMINHLKKTGGMDRAVRELEKRFQAAKLSARTDLRQTGDQELLRSMQENQRLLKEIGNFLQKLDKVCSLFV